MSIVDAARAAADRLLLFDECTIHELGEPVFDPDTETYVTPETVVYDGRCHLGPFSGAGEISEELGGEIVVTVNYRLTLPWDAPRVRKEAVVTMIDSKDPGLVGRRFRVDHEMGETFQTARRLIVEAIDTTEEASS